MPKPFSLWSPSLTPVHVRDHQRRSGPRFWRGGGGEVSNVVRVLRARVCHVSLDGPKGFTRGGWGQRGCVRPYGFFQRGVNR